MKNLAEVLARSTQTEGWLSRHAAALIHFFLSHQPAAERNVLEIGVFKGKSAILLAYETAQRNESLILLDIQIQPEITAIAQLHPKIETIESDSFNLPNLAPVQRAAPFRFIHIDGAHGYSHVMDDIKNAARLLSWRGIICLDDFFQPAWPDVTAAAFDFLAGRDHDLVLFLAGFNKGLLCRSIALQSYCELIEGPLAASMGELGCRAVVKKRTQTNPFCFYGVVTER
jgi:predicted O-methyltransferase YrrM